jgi:hypothetical protein
VYGHGDGPGLSETSVRRPRTPTSAGASWSTGAEGSGGRSCTCATWPGPSSWG